MTKRVAVVTGGTSGLGEAAALALAAKRWKVLVTGRDPGRGADVVTRARAAGGDATFLAADLFTIAGVRALGASVRRASGRVDLLINNAGGTFGKVELTADGLERTVALNVMAPYVLTEELAAELAASRGRVVNLVTGIPKGATSTMDQLFGERPSAGLGQYTRAKLALLALTREQQRRYLERGLELVALHPGIIPGTRFGQDMPAFLRAIGGFMAKLFRFGSSLDEAAARYLSVGTEPVLPGGFYDQGRLADGPTLAADPGFGAEVWGRLASLGARKDAAGAGDLALA